MEHTILLCLKAARNNGDLIFLRISPACGVERKARECPRVYRGLRRFPAHRRKTKKINK